MLTKSVAVTVKATAADDAALEDGQFTALASVFNNIDDVGDIVLPGAFTDNLKEWKDSGDTIPLYWAHRMDDPQMCIGSILTAEETDTGLLVKAALDLENPTAAQVYKLLKGRRVRRMSFAYDIDEGGSVEKDGVYAYELRKLSIHEVSVVQIPANPEAAVQSVKRKPAATKNAPRVAREESVLRKRRSRVKATADDAELTALLGQADQAIDDAESSIADADAAMDAVFKYLGLDDTDEDAEQDDAGKARDTATKSGRVLSAKNESTLREALDKVNAAGTHIKGVLAALENDDSNDDSKASPTQQASAEEPAQVKASAARLCPASVALRTDLDLLAVEI